MTALHQIGSIESLLSNSPLSTSKLWWRDIASITGSELYAFVARMGYEGYGREARHNVEIALGEARHAAALGKIASISILNLKMPAPRVTLGEVRSLLARTSITRRKAILYALETGTPLREVVELRWNKAFKLELSEQARLVLLGMPRHIGTNLVFWEYSRTGRPLPLLGLVEEVSGMLRHVEWDEFVRQYQDAILYDYDAEWSAFKAALSGI